MSENTQRTSAAALRTIISARISCTNTMHELEVIDNLTDDWNLDNGRLATDSLEIHLQAEFCAKEASTIFENLNTIMTTGRMAVLEEWLCMELELRRENAILAATEIISIIDALEAAFSTKAISTDELGLVEMKRRAQLIVEKLHSLQDRLVKLALDWKAAVEASSKPRESDGDMFRYAEIASCVISPLRADMTPSPRAVPGM